MRKKDSNYPWKCNNCGVIDLAIEHWDSELTEHFGQREVTHYIETMTCASCGSDDLTDNIDEDEETDAC